MKREIKYFISIMALFLICSCHDNNRYNDIQINYFYKDVCEYPEYQDSAKSEFKLIYKNVFQYIYQNDFSDSLILNIPQSKVYQYFRNDVNKVYDQRNKISEILSQFNADINGFSDNNIKYKFNLIITPYKQPILICDSTVIIGLNHYLGTSHESYNYYNEFIRRRKNPDDIKYDLSENLCKSIIPQPEIGTLLDNIIYEGIILSMQTEIHKTTPEIIFHYTDDETKWFNENQGKIWNTIVGKDFLFSKSNFIINDIIHPVPFSSLINQKCPPETGRIMGYKIVKSYLKETNTLVNFKNLKLIAKLDSKTILNQSKYNGF